MSKTVLLTGSTGFIGRNIKEQLTGYKLLTPTRKELDLLNQDEVYHYLMGMKSSDIIIHSAGKEAPICLADNIRMFLNILQYCNCKVIYFGSGAEGRWSNEYGLSKKIMQEIAEKKPNVFNLRLYGVFGKYEDEHRRFLSVCCKSILSKHIINIYDNIRFNYLYVNDLVKIVQWFMENNPREKDYDVCSPDTLHLSDWADTLMHNVGEKTEVILHNCSGSSYTASSWKLREECKMEFTPIEQSLKELYEYYRTRTTV